MTMKTCSGVLGFHGSLAGGCLVLAALLVSGCVEDVDSAVGAAGNVGTAGSAGAGSPVAGSGGAPSSGAAGSGTVSSSGAGGGGGAGAYANDATFGTGSVCPAPASALITDFTYVPPATDAGEPNTTGVAFGDFTTAFSGSTFVYPNAGTYAVSSDVTDDNWHMSGSLGDYSGFGVTFNCSRFDASAYAGIAFTIQGSVPLGNTVTLSVGTAENQITHLWLNMYGMPLPNPPAAPNSGRCVPASLNQYDGSCGSPTFTVPVTVEPTEIEVTWAQLTGGRPAAAVNPSEITGIAWNFPPPGGAGTNNPTPYDVDLIIDNLRFLPAP